MPDPLRVLLIAEACNPTWTSVPLVGYNVARALAERPDLRIALVTHVRNREGLAGDPLLGSAEVHFLDTEWLARPVWQLSRLLRGGDGLAWTTDTALAWPSYVAFEDALFRQFGKRLERGEFDLIHRVTPLSPTIPSPLAGCTRVPMLIGPLNGGLPWPREYPELRAREKEWLVPLRGFSRLLPWAAATWRHAAGVIAGSRHTAREVPRFFRGQRFYLPENGIDPARFPVAAAWPEPAGRFRFVFVGRLVPYKGADLVLEALAGSAALASTELHIVGDGPERAKLEAMAVHLGLADRVHFRGWLPQAEFGNELTHSHALVFPSLREFGGGVVLEAMAAGLPAVVADYGGPAELVTPETGVLLPMRPRAELVGALRSALEGLAGDPERCRHLGAAAARRVREEFTWSAKAATLVGMYREVLGGRSLPLAPTARKTLAPNPSPTAKPGGEGGKIGGTPVPLRNPA
jgi:glycosyltransferase involved in cell wall biosynthesis